MASRKAREAEKLRKKRVAAAKKGWETREKNARKRAREARKSRPVKRKTPERTKRKAQKAKAVKQPGKKRPGKKPAAKRIRRVVQIPLRTLKKKRAPRAKLQRIVSKQVQKLKRENAELRKRQREQRKAVRKAQKKLKKERLKWVAAHSIENLRMDGSIAAKPSMARHLPNALEMYGALHAARLKGNAYFSAIASVLASKYKLTIQEVYTLYFSP